MAQETERTRAQELSDSEQVSTWLRKQHGPVTNVLLRDCAPPLVTLAKSKLERCEFKRLTFSEAKFEQVVFRDTVFDDVTFSSSMLHDVTFEGCTFRFGVFEEATLHDCRFIDCTWQTPTIRRTKMSNTRWQNTALLRTRFESSSFDACSMGAGKQEETIFKDCQLTRCTFSEAAWRRVFFRGSSGSDVTLTKVKMEDCSFESGRFERFSWSACTGNCVRLLVLELVDLTLAHNGELERVRLTDCHCSGFKLIENELLSELHITSTQLTDVTLEGGLYPYLTFEATTITGKSEMGYGAFYGVKFEGSRIDDLHIHHQSFAGYLVLSSTTFTRLKLEEVLFEDDLDRHLEAVTYQDSDHFPG